MQTTSSNSTRIAKNTFFLYLRSFFTLIISLYTSRIVLEVLGVVDYGIFSVVATTIGMVSFINNSMAATYQRYFNYEMGQNNITNLKKMFHSSITVQFIYSFIIVLIAETIGLWFLENKMVIPADRIYAAHIIYHLSIASFAFSVLSAPFNALIIAYEKMNIFAYLSILDAILKLIFVISLRYIPGDNLIVYGGFSFFLILLNLILYIITCRTKFPTFSLSLNFDRSNMKKMLNFGTWGMVDSLSYTLKSQGLNLLLNIFFGPIVNAARGIAYQILTAVQQFITSFQVAFRPQIVKSYSEGNLKYMYKLYYSATKISCYMLWMLSLPIIIETDNILYLWLGNNIPEYTVSFTRIILLTALVEVYANPTSAIAYATGKIKSLSIYVSGLNLLILPTAYLFLKFGYNPESAMLISLAFSILVQIVRIYILKTLLPFSVIDYLKQVILPTIFVFVLSAVVAYIAKTIIPENTFSCIYVCVLAVFGTMTIIWLYGLKNEEKVFVTSKLKILKNKF